MLNYAASISYLTLLDDKQTDECMSVHKIKIVMDIACWFTVLERILGFRYPVGSSKHKD